MHAQVASTEWSDGPHGPQEEHLSHLARLPAVIMAKSSRFSRSRHGRTSCNVVMYGTTTFGKDFAKPGTGVSHAKVTILSSTVAFKHAGLHVIKRLGSPQEQTLPATEKNFGPSPSSLGKRDVQSEIMSATRHISCPHLGVQHWPASLWHSNRSLKIGK